MTMMFDGQPKASDGWWQLETPYAIGRVLFAQGVMVEADSDDLEHLIGSRLGKLWKRYAFQRIEDETSDLMPGIQPQPKRYAVAE